MRTSKMNRIRTAATCLTVGAVLTGMALTGVAQTSTAPSRKTAPPAKDLPPAKQIIMKAVKGMGGMKAFKDIRSAHMKMSMTAPMGQASFETWQLGDEFRVNISQSGMNIVSGGNKDHAWMQNPMTGAWNLAEDAQVEEMRRMATMYRMVIDLEEQYDEVSTVGKAEFEGQTCYDIQAVGDVSTDHYYFSVDDDHFVGMKSIVEEGPMGRMESTMVMGERKKFGDLMMASSMTITQMGMAMNMTIDELQFNKVEPEQVKMPEEVRELIKNAEDNGPASQPSSRPRR